MLDNKIKIGIIIQARLGSTRLPRKVLLPIGDISLVNHIVRKFEKSSETTVVATTTSAIDDELATMLEKSKVTFFRGSENDVLERFIVCAEQYKFSHIVRICADNPFVDYSFFKQLLNEFSDLHDIDYLSFSYRNKPTILSHFGVFAEIVSVKSLKKVHNEFSENKTYREHVTIGVYSNPELFNIKLIPIDELVSKYDGIRLTLDTQEDYNNTLAIRNIEGFRDDMTFREIGELVLSSANVLNSMKLIIQANKK